MSRPWTPGPWSLVTDSPYAGSSQSYEIRYGSGDSYDNVLLADEQYYPTAPEKMADAELIALAPEMAEAIIKQVDYCKESGYCHCIDQNMHPLANKLRAIGQDND